MTTSPGSPLVVSADQALVAEVVRLAAAAGAVPQVVTDVAVALRFWSTAPVVLVGPDRAAALAAAAPPRRARVHVVGVGPPGATLFRDALGCGADSVLDLPAAGSALVDLLADAVDEAGIGADGPGVLIGVIGGAGGVGATVFATALAQAISATVAVLLVDADPHGAGIDRVLGLEGVDGVRWDGLAQATGRLGARSLRNALPGRGRLSVLTWSADRSRGLPAATMREALSAGCRGYDAVVVDLPRYPDPVVDDVLVRCDHVLLVSTTTVPAVAAAARVARRLPAATSTVVLRGPGGGVGEPEVSHLLGLPVLVRMPDQRGLDEAVSLGLGPTRSRRGPLARAAGRAAAALRRSAR